MPASETTNITNVKLKPTWSVTSIFMAMLLIATSAGRYAHAEQPQGDEAKIAGLIQQLGENLFKGREIAQAELLKIGSPIRKQVEDAAQNSDNAEIVARCKAILVELDKREYAEKLKPLTKNFLWKTKIPGPIDYGKITPFENGVCCFSGKSLIMLDAKTGKVTWKTEKIGRSYLGLGMSGNAVILLGGSKGLEKINAKTGKDEQVPKPLSFAHGTLMEVVDGKVFGPVYQRSHSKWMYKALDLDAGKELWCIDPPKGFNGRPLFARGGMLYTTLRTGKGKEATMELIAMDPASGKPTWTFSRQGSHDGFYDIAANTDAVFCRRGNSGTILNAIDRQSGKLIWELKLDMKGAANYDVEGFMSTGAMPLLDGKLCITVFNRLFCINTKTGKECWHSDIKGIALPLGIEPDDDIAFSQAAMMKNPDGSATAYIASINGLYAYDINTGKQLWTLPVTGMSPTRPVIENGVIYFSNTQAATNLYESGLTFLHAYRIPVIIKPER